MTPPPPLREGVRIAVIADLAAGDHPSADRLIGKLNDPLGLRLGPPSNHPVW